MKQSRRKFIKTGFLSAIGALFVPGAFGQSEIKAYPVDLNYKPNPAEWNENELNIAWLGHSTMLINFYGKIILTDPVLFDRIGLYFFGGSIGPSRLTPPALTVDEIPKPDLILLSHAHMDHTDLPTLEAITDKYPNQIDLIVAYLCRDVIEDMSWRSITMLDWDEEANIQNIRIKAFEVAHFGWRFPWEKDRSRGYMKDGRSYNAYLIDYNGKKVLFGGDTRMTDKLDILKQENIEVALMPIGAYNPWKHAHCNPEEALQMTEAFGAKTFIPMHCKTFQQGKEPFNEPIDWMLNSASNYNLEIGLKEIGQTYTTV